MPLLLLFFALFTAGFQAKKTYDKMNEKGTYLAIAAAVLAFLATFAATIVGMFFLFSPLLFHR